MLSEDTKRSVNEYLINSKRARKDYLEFAKSKKHSTKKIRVDIVFLADLHIPLDLVRRQRVAVRTAGVMVIDTVKFDFVPVQIEQRAINFHF